VKRTVFLTASLAVLGAALPRAAQSSESGNVTPDEALARLMAGNRRFVNGDVPALDHVARRRQELEQSQSPFAAILSCSDSRVVPEDVFVCRPWTVVCRACRRKLSRRHGHRVA
jgi:carbonic anhydrase